MTTLRQAALIARDALAPHVSASYCELCNASAPIREHDGLILADVPHTPDCPFGVLNDALEAEEVIYARTGTR